MNGEYLLDASAVIAILRGREGAAERLHDADRVSINSTVVGELYYGALRSPRVDDSLNRIEAFLDLVAVCRCTENTARHYARIKAVLQLQGRSPFRKTTSGLPPPLCSIILRWSLGTTISIGSPIFARNAGK